MAFEVLIISIWQTFGQTLANGSIVCSTSLTYTQFTLVHETSEKYALFVICNVMKIVTAGHPCSWWYDCVVMFAKILCDVCATGGPNLEPVVCACELNEYVCVCEFGVGLVSVILARFKCIFRARRACFCTGSAQLHPAKRKAPRTKHTHTLGMPHIHTRIHGYRIEKCVHPDSRACAPYSLKLIVYK